MVHDSENIASRDQNLCVNNAALQGSTAQTNAENDGYGACEWIPGL
jgi:hypothetical protein